MKKILPNQHSLAIAVTLTLAFFTTSFANAQEKTLTLTGFNVDVIADPVLNTTPAGLANSSVDLPAASANIFFADGYSTDDAPLPNGLPANGQITSSAGHNFQLADYTSNNDLRLEADETGTLTFDVADQISYTTLYLLTTGGSGSPDLGYTINFSDATTTTGTFTAQDWFCNNCLSYAIKDLSRINRTVGNVVGSNQFAMREYTINLSATDQAKLIVSIDFTVLTGQPGVGNIFGITAVAASVAPVTLEYFSVRGDNGKATLQWKTSQELNNKKFIIERAASNQPSLFVAVGEVQATTSANGTVYNYTNTPGVSGTYLYRLTQEDIDGHRKILGTKSVNLTGKVKWIIQDLGSEWRIICGQPFTYRVLDMNGRILKASNGSGSESIAKPAQHGIYEVQVETGGESSTQKMIK